MIDRWKEDITRGNTEFSLQYFDEAILLFNQALAAARADFHETAQASYGRAISKVVICHFNLADCYIALGQYTRACEQYCQARQFLLSIDLEAGDTDGELTLAIDHAMGHVISVWQQFLQKCQTYVPHEWQVKFKQGVPDVFPELPAEYVIH